MSYRDLREWTCVVCGGGACVPHAGVSRPLPEGWADLDLRVIAGSACGTCYGSIRAVVERAALAEVALIRAKAVGLRAAHAEADDGPVDCPSLPAPDWMSEEGEA